MANPEAYVDENSNLAPVSLYAELKVKFEKYLLYEMKKELTIFHQHLYAFQQSMVFPQE